MDPDGVESGHALLQQFGQLELDRGIAIPMDGVCSHVTGKFDDLPNSSCQGALFPNHVLRYRINSTLPNTGGYFLPRLGWLENLNGFLVSSWTLHRVKA